MMTNPRPINELRKRNPVPLLEGKDVERFWRYVDKSEDCWIWTGSISGNKTHKYGDMCVGGRSHRAHRLSYRYSGRELPTDLLIDHLCRNTLCVNPAHLEAVTHAENVHRGNAYPTHCKRGHPLSGDNVLLREGVRRGRCRICDREKSARYNKLHPEVRAIWRATRRQKNG